MSKWPVEQVYCMILVGHWSQFWRKSCFCGRRICGKKFGEGELVCHAIRAHHDEEKPTPVIAHIVQAANLLSNTRPGARRPGMDNFIHRLNEIWKASTITLKAFWNLCCASRSRSACDCGSTRRWPMNSVMLSRDIVRKVERELPHLGSICIQVLSRNSQCGTRSLEKGLPIGTTEDGNVSFRTMGQSCSAGQWILSIKRNSWRSWKKSYASGKPFRIKIWCGSYAAWYSYRS